VIPTSYNVLRNTGNTKFVCASAPTYDEALRIADARTKADRILHTVEASR